MLPHPMIWPGLKSLRNGTNIQPDLLDSATWLTGLLQVVLAFAARLTWIILVLVFGYQRVWLPRRALGLNKDSQVSFCSKGMDVFACVFVCLFVCVWV